MLLEHLRVIVRPSNPTLHAQSHLEIQDYICGELEKQGRTVTVQDFPTSLTDHRGRPIVGKNLLSGTTDGRTPNHLVVAHYDTVDHSPGADDNRSAVAIALELSKTCPHTCFLFPDLEERDLLGSRHFVKSEVWPSLPALVLESVGYWSEEPNSQSFPAQLPVLFPQQHSYNEQRDFRGNFWAILCLDKELQKAQALANDLSGETLVLPVPETLFFGPEGEKLRDFGRSDHLAFWEQNRSCLMLTDTANFRNPNYHQISDLIDSLNLEKMSELTLDLSKFLNGSS